MSNVIQSSSKQKTEYRKHYGQWRVIEIIIYSLNVGYNVDSR